MVLDSKTKKWQHSGQNHGDSNSDILYQILEYISTTDLYSLGVCGSKFLCDFIFSNPITGGDEASSSFQQMIGHNNQIFKPYGRQYLQNCFYFKQSIVVLKEQQQKGEYEKEKVQKRKRRGYEKKKKQKQARKKRGRQEEDVGKLLSITNHPHHQDDDDDNNNNNNNNTEKKSLLNRIGLFTKEEEDSIVINNSNGYFGVDFIRPRRQGRRRQQRQQRQTKTNESKEDEDGYEEGVIAIWGDYSGIFLTTNVNNILKGDANVDVDAATTTTNVDVDAATTTTTTTSTTTTPMTATATTSIVPNHPIHGDSGYLFGDSLQVMSILFASKENTYNSNSNNKKHNSNSYVFIGFASGKIYCIDSNPVENHIASCCVKTNGVTTSAISIVQEIVIHWNAMIDGNLQRITTVNINPLSSSSSILEGIMTPNVPSPLAMSSSTFYCDWNNNNSNDNNNNGNDTTITTRSKKRRMTFLSIGSRNQTLTNIWWDTDDETIAFDETTTTTTTTTLPNNSMEKYMNIQLSSYDKSSFELSAMSTTPSLKLPRFNSWCNYLKKRSRARGQHHIVYTKYATAAILILGTSKGDLIRINMNPKPEQTESEFEYVDIDDDQDHEQEDRCDIVYNCCRSGMVESVELVGNCSNSNSSCSSGSGSSSIMITAGGSDGKIRFWDWNTFTCLGYLSIHPGRLIVVLLPPNNQALAAAAGRSSSGANKHYVHQQHDIVRQLTVGQLYYIAIVGFHCFNNNGSNSNNN
ncbi:hypothetical protein FRACYDRAFT_254907 [Fragilariopsis cylindrus CCMP1102]|uniref:WD40 repeat-like protein n=1 Tax=Fragilariopsis cylindrus CCMP1102 TaxID=635003 RepID=A0A1E7EK84_9STRA|nr:hypothetical protein FRACYDRAFT_254907 [Fragilariopsis cylindrus CCMP1102]|eukprot:OEU06339.1 hypothetical protein FRACYDRAFT_254907 [Fragilariopsis cylindrus CCMP1102]